MIHLLLQTALSSPGPFEWASQHVHLVGWGTIVWLVWKAGQFFNQAKVQVTTTVTQIDRMATNHFPHMERALMTMDKNIASLTRHTTGDAIVTEE